jgi:hypothetical protein
VFICCTRPAGQQIQLGDDGQIQPGAQGRPAIETALAQAKVALLLVSDAVLASDRASDRASDLPSEVVRGRPVPDGLGPAELRQPLP